jgi:ribosomal protein S7
MLHKTNTEKSRQAIRQAVEKTTPITRTTQRTAFGSGSPVKMKIKAC